MRGLCRNVPQFEGEELHAMGSPSERAMSECDIG